jgi:hypothetical protein
MDKVYRQVVSLIDTSKATPAQKLQARNMAMSFYQARDDQSLFRMLNRFAVGASIKKAPSGFVSLSPPLFNDNFNPRNQMPQVPAKAYPLYSNFGVKI